jgi:RimJ/RimL family protein N-acetyltransferase
MPLSALPRLVTRRLVLEPLSAGMARALLDGAEPGMPLGAGYPHADSLDALRLREGSDEPLPSWLVVVADTGAVVGDVGVKGPPDETGRVEIGYGLAAPSRGRGYGAEAVAAMVGWLEEQDEVRTVVAEVEVGNVASRRLLERLGFSVEENRAGCWVLARQGRPGIRA